MIRKLLIWIFFVTMVPLLWGQSFINLDFESTQVVPSYTNNFGRVFLSTTDALPGWSAFSGTTQLSSIQYNPSLTSIPPQIALFSSNRPVLAGNFSVLLNAGGSAPASISQSGLVPVGTGSLVFDASFTQGPPADFLVSLGGQNLPYATISTATNAYGLSFNVYAADVSAFAGQMENLTFSGFGILDDIQFSQEAVPEPSAVPLFLLGSGILFFTRSRKQPIRCYFE